MLDAIDLDSEEGNSEFVEVVEDDMAVVKYPMFNPPVSSPAVLEQREELLGAFNLKDFVEDLGRMGKYIRVAYNGIGAAGAEFQALQIEVQTLGYDISGLCDKSAVTISRFKTTTRTILFELKAAYQFLLKGKEKIALDSFSLLSKLSGKMAKAAEELQIDFSKQESKVKEVLKNTKMAVSEQDLKVRDLKSQQEKAKVDLEVKDRLSKENEKLEAECRAARRRLERKEDKELSAKSGFLNRLGNFFTTSIGLGALFGDDSSAQLRANRWRQRSLEKLEEEKEYRKLKQEALQSMAELVYKIKAMEGEKDISKVAFVALHKTSGSLQKIIRLLAQAALFWNRLKTHCQDMADSEIQGKIQTYIDNFSEQERIEHWASNQFKEGLFIYVSKWVALHGVSSEYLDQIKQTQKQLWDYMTENPTYQESRENLKEMVENFEEDLISAQVEMEQKSIEAGEKEKWLKEDKRDEL